MLVETDAPYLAPCPIAASATSRPIVAETARAVAEVKGMAPEALAAATRANTLQPVLQNAAAGRRACEPRATILGCGSSAGVPRVAQGWGACDPANPRNRRRRCALLVERAGEAARRPC